jgi:beta-phosphoglucomutase-like phosphatase (HAD superfamily)
MRFAGLILDCDGVLLESEWAGNAQIADFLSKRGFPTTVEQAMANFMGLAGPEFLAAIERWIGAPIPADFESARRAADEHMIRDGIAEVKGAVRFVRSLDPALPKAVASSSSREWVERHLEHLGIRDLFGDHLFSGRTDVVRGKPAPDLYWHVAERLSVPIEHWRSSRIRRWELPGPWRRERRLSGWSPAATAETVMPTACALSAPTTLPQASMRSHRSSLSPNARSWPSWWRCNPHCAD